MHHWQVAGLHGEYHLPLSGEFPRLNRIGADPPCANQALMPSAAIPALAICASSFDFTPDTPTAPIT